MVGWLGASQTAWVNPLILPLIGYDFGKGTQLLT